MRVFKNTGLIILICLSLFLTSCKTQQNNSDDGYSPLSSSAKEEKSELPRLDIDIDNGEFVIEKKEYKKGIAALSQTKDEYTFSERPVQIRGRGNSTWAAPKRPYKIKFDEKTDMFGFGEARDWVLLANYYDKTLMRTAVAYNVAVLFDTMEFIPRTQSVDLFINGEYEGVYLLTDQIEVNPIRVKIPKTQNAETGFMLEVDSRIDDEEGSVEDKHYIALENGYNFAIHFPDPDVITPEQVKYIKDYLTSVQEAVYKGEGYEEYIDVDSFVDWALFSEIFKNVESGFNSSCYFVKRVGEKMRMEPLWDYDLSAGNYEYEPFREPNSFICIENSVWFKNLYVKSDVFRYKFIERWNKLKDPVKELFEKNVNEYSKILKEPSKRDDKTWETLRHGYWPNPEQVVRAKTFDAQVRYYKSWMNERYSWLNQVLVWDSKEIKGIILMPESEEP